jgi:hypothetical protein
VDGSDHDLQGPGTSYALKKHMVDLFLLSGKIRELYWRTHIGLRFCKHEKVKCVLSRLEWHIILTLAQYSSNKISCSILNLLVRFLAILENWNLIGL